MNWVPPAELPTCAFQRPTADMACKVMARTSRYDSCVTFRRLQCSQPSYGKEKVKYTLVQALRLCTGRTAYRASRGIALLFHDHGTRKG